jgi:hypothetical protein
MISFAEIYYPKLKSLCLISRNVEEEIMEHFANIYFPELENLTLHLENELEDVIKYMDYLDELHLPKLNKFKKTEQQTDINKVHESFKLIDINKSCCGDCVGHMLLLN